MVRQMTPNHLMWVRLLLSVQFFHIAQLNRVLGYDPIDIGLSPIMSTIKLGE